MSPRGASKVREARFMRWAAPIRARLFSALSRPYVGEDMVPGRKLLAFTIIELLVVIAIIGLLASVLMPALSRARTEGKSTLCMTRLRTLGQGIVLYAEANSDKLLPGRMPKLDDENWQVEILGGVKYRPTFLAMMGDQIGIPPFDDPQTTKLTVDRDGEPGDRQNYANEAYVCPEVREWTDERNGCYGYNYQFLGNSRLIDSSDPRSFKNWPRNYSLIRSPGRTVAVGDSLGTAAAFHRHHRGDYSNNSRSMRARGNEGFNLDPPAVDPEHGEIAGHTGDEAPARSAVHERHGGKANILWLDGHVSRETLETLGYVIEEGGIVGVSGKNHLWSGDQKDRVWLPR